MKRLVSLILAIIMVLQMGISAFAIPVIEKASFSLNTSSSKVTNGETFTIDVIVDKEVIVAGLELEVGFDNTAVEFVAYENGEVAPAALGITEPEDVTDCVSLIFEDSKMKGVTISAGVLAKLSFKVKDDAEVGNHTPSLDIVTLTDKDAEDIECEVGTVDSFEIIKELSSADVSLPDGMDSIPVPKAGENVPAIDLVEGDGIESATYEVTPNDDKYSAGKTYTETITIVPEDGYVFDENTKVNIGGIDVEYDEETGNLIGTRTTEVSKNGITSIEVMGDIPAEPAIKAEKPSSVSLSADNADVSYEITANDGNEIGEKYRGDVTYTEIITVVPGENYEFGKDTEVKLNDKDGAGFIGKLEENGNYVFTRETEVDKIVIDKITISGYVEPAIYGTYDMGASIVVETEGVNSPFVMCHFVKANGDKVYLFPGNKYIGDTEYIYDIALAYETKYYKLADEVELLGAEGFEEVERDSISIAFEKTIKTASANLTGIEITSEPFKKDYVYGEDFDVTGMVVTAKYDDGTSKVLDANEYVIDTELVPGITEVTVKYGGKTNTIDEITVAKKELEIVGLETVDRVYDRTAMVKITGGTLVGVIAGDEVGVLLMPDEGYVADANASDAEKEVTLPGQPTLVGEDKDYYTLKEVSVPTVKISKQPITDCEIDAINKVIYNSEAHKPEVKIDYKGALIKGTDYTVEYGENIKAGEGTVTITGIGNYRGSTTIRFTIERKGIDIYYAKAMDKVYDGTDDAIITAGELIGVYAGDDVKIDDIKGNFISKYVDDIPIDVIAESDFVISGDDAENYFISESSYNKNFRAMILSAHQTFTVKELIFTVVKNGRTDLLKNVESSLGDKAKYEFALENDAWSNGVALEDGHYIVTTDEAQLGNLFHVSVTAKAVSVGGSTDPEYSESLPKFFQISIVNKPSAGLTVDSKTVEHTFGDPDFEIGAEVSSEAEAENGTWEWKIKNGDNVVSITNDKTAKPTFSIKNAGTATVTAVYESANFRSEETITINVARKNLADEDIIVSGVESEYEYTGEGIAPKPTLKFGDITLEFGKDYLVNHLPLGSADSTNASEDGIKIEIPARAESNYTGKRSVTYKIVPKDLSKVTVKGIGSVEYDGTEHTPEPILVDGEKVLVLGDDFTAEYSGDQTNVGVVEVTVKGKGNYKGDAKTRFAIMPLTLTLEAEAEDKVYDGTDKATIKAGELSGVVEGDVVEVTASIEGKFDDQYAGTGKTVTTENEFVLSGKDAGNYLLTQPSGFAADITAAEQNLTVVIDEKTAARNAETDLKGCVSSNAANAKIEFEIVGSVDYAEINGSKVRIDASAVAGDEFIVKATSAAVNVDEKGNAEYEAASEVTFKVVVTNKKDAEIDVTDTINKVYRDADFLVAAKVNDAAAAENGEWSWTFVSGDDVVSISREDIAKPYFSIKKVGTAILKVVYESATYRDEAQVTINVDRKEITDADVKFEFYDINDLHVYDGEEITLSYGTHLKYTDYEIVYENNVNAGTAKVTVKGIGNYKGEFSKEFEIKAYNLTDGNVKFANPSEKFVYGGDEKKPEVVVKAGIKTLVKDTDYTVSYSDNVDAGTATVTVEGIGNYSGKVTKEFVINQKEVTVVAAATNRPYEDGNVKVEVKASGIEGLIGEDASTVVLVKDTIEGTVKDPWAEDGKDVTLGEDFAITGEGAENYKVKQPIIEVNITTFVQEFILTGKKLEVARGSKVNLRTFIESNVGDKARIEFMIYDANGTGAVVNGDTELVVPAEAEVGTIFKISAYSLSKNLGGTIVEEFSIARGVYEFKVVEKQETTVTIRNKVTEKTFGDKDFGMGVSANPVDGNGTYTWTSSDESVIKVLDPNNTNGKFEVVGVGKATITATYEDNTYLGSDSVEIEVKAKEIAKPKADTKTYTYNGKDQTYNLAENSAYTIENATQKDAGTYEVTVELKDKVNTQWADGTVDNLTYEFVIKKATVTVTAKDQSAVVGGKAPELGEDSYTIKGLFGDDSIEVEIEYASTPNMGAPGSVRIIVSGPANVPNSNNYEEINYVNGTLTISKRRTEKEEVSIDLRNPSTEKTDDESNPNTGAPVVESAFGAGHAIAAVLGGLVVLGKRK